jgi:acetylornithine deacetylase/succinyl-diaminopimelate desuccinylase-like protein
MQKAIEYAKLNQKKFQQELFQWLAIPSISADSKYKKEVRQAAEFIANHLKKIGLDKVLINSTAGHPIVTAEKQVAKNKPTVLIYGHYDVQPPDPLELWDSSPFKPKIKKGRVYARGANDNKGQVFIHLKSLESYLHSGELPLNIKCIIEGEEEIGSPNLFPFLIQKKKQLQADYVLISDTEMLGENQPTITYGLRGLCYLEIIIKGSNNDLHSGMLGGVVANPANVLTKLLADLSDNYNSKEFNKLIRPLSMEENFFFNKLPLIKKQSLQKLGIRKLLVSNSYSYYEKNSALPTMDINGLESGYTGEGAKTIIPAWAKVKVSFRLVPDQNHNQVVKIIKKKLHDYFPKNWGLQMIIKTFAGGEPFITELDSLGIKAAKLSLKKVFSKDPYLIRSGCSIPIVSEFKKKLGADIILMGFGLSEDKIHSPNESFSLKIFKKGIESSIFFLNILNDITIHKD